MVVVDDILYAVSQDHYIYAMYRLEGTVKWSYNTGASPGKAFTVGMCVCVYVCMYVYTQARMLCRFARGDFAHPRTRSALPGGGASPPHRPTHPCSFGGKGPEQEKRKGTRRGETESYKLPGAC